MRIKMTRDIIAQKKAEAHAANNTWEVVSKPLVRSYILPANPRASKVAWLGIKATHRRSGLDTFAFQQRYAMG